MFKYREISFKGRAPKLPAPYPFLQRELYLKAEQPALFMIDAIYTGETLAADKLVLGVKVGVLRQLDDNVEVQLEFPDLSSSLADNGTSDTRRDEDFQEVVTGLRALGGGGVREEGV